MKDSTKVFAKLESRGYPDKTRIISGNIKEIALAWVKWSLEPGVYLGSKMVITIARTESELDSKESGDADMAAELDKLLNEQGELRL